jgi:hypothetical protein
VRFSLEPWLDKLDSLTFAQLANVQTVGIGLYLALAIIQAVSHGGVAGLRRRAITLSLAINSARKVSLQSESSSIITDLGALEMGFEKANRTILLGVVLLFIVSVFYFAYCTIWQAVAAHILGSLFIFGFYLALPVVLFLMAAQYIRIRCRAIDQRINELQSAYLDSALGNS